METTSDTAECVRGHKKSGRLGELLIKENSITPAQLEQALELQRKQGGRLGTCLVKLGFLSEEEITATLSRQCGIPSINLANLEVDRGLMRLIPMETALKLQVLPLSRVGSSLTLAMADPSNVSTMDDIKQMTGFSIEPVVSSEASLERAIRKLYGSAEEQERRKEVGDLDRFTGEGPAANVLVEDELAFDLGAPENAEEAPVTKLVHYILAEAVERRASDIHLESSQKEFCLRYRIDGALQGERHPPARLREAVINRLKKMAKIDSVETQLPQEGRAAVRMSREGRKKEVDLRVSVLPTAFGEKIAVKVFDRETRRFDLVDLGYEAEALEKFRHAIGRPFGMVLVTGPAGSGRTTTLYSSISELNGFGVNILTAEDPVKFQLPGISQVEVKESIGINLATALHSILRQDPDVIMVDELCDIEAARIAIKASLTGNLVLSTLPASDTASAISWLLDMGIEPFLIANSVRLICAQRLVRRICPQCMKQDDVRPQILLDAGFVPEKAAIVRVYRGAGCAACNNKGYKGCTGIFEVLEVTSELREMILAGASAPELRKRAIDQGMMTLRRSGLLKVAGGITSLEETLRETAP